MSLNYYRLGRVYPRVRTRQYYIRGKPKPKILTSDVQGTSNNFVISQSATYNYAPHFDSGTNTLSLTQSINTVRILTVPQTFTINQVAVGTTIKSESVTSNIAFSQLVGFVLVNQVNQTLSLSQQATVNLKVLNRSASNTLNLSQTVSVSPIYTRSLTSTLQLVQGQNKKTNLPGDSIFVPGALVGKVSKSVVFENSINSAAIILPRPLPSDTEGLQSELIAKTAITGKKYTYARKADTRKLSYSFNLSTIKARELQKFIENNLSDRLTMFNFRGEVWNGYITNNPVSFDISGRDGECTDRYQVTIEFEGVNLNVLC